MRSTRAIEVDFDVHQLIEANRLGFQESPNDVLRRLLGLASEAGGVERKSFFHGTLELPHGTQARMTYNGVSYRASILDGWWVIETGERCASPSGAASALAVTKRGSKTKLDGWLYWYVKRPGDSEFVSLAEAAKLPRRRQLGVTRIT